MGLKLKKLIGKILATSLIVAQIGNNVVLAEEYHIQDLNKQLVVENSEVIDSNVEIQPVVEVDVTENEDFEFTTEDEEQEELRLEGHSGKRIEAEGIDENLILPAGTDKDINWVNNIGAYPIANGGQTQLVNEWEDTVEYISPLTGELSLNVTDIELPGRNDFNLTIGRIFRSENALPGQKKYSYNEISFEEGNYYHDTYELGLGWSFTFPSVELKGNAVYYHTGNGETYLVNTGSTYSNLENYTEKDIKFTSGSYTTSTGAKAKYRLQKNSGEKQYFDSKGLLLEIVDRFNNTIKFKYKYYLKGDTYDDDYTEVASSDSRSKKALLYQITDSVNRDIIFEYETYGDLTLKIFESRTNASDDPSVNTSRKPTNTIVYEREKERVDYVGQLVNGSYERERWYVQKLVAVDKTYGSDTYGGYTKYVYGSSLSVACMHQYHYDELRTEEVDPGDACPYCGDLDFLTIKKIIKPSSQVTYTYEKVRKAIDTFYGLYQEGEDDDYEVLAGDIWWAFYDTARVSERSEQYKPTSSSAFTGAERVENYSYAGTYTHDNKEYLTKDETGYTFRNGGENSSERDMIQRIKKEQEYTVTLTTPGYTETQITYKDSKKVKEVETDLKTNQVLTKTYKYNDPNYPDKYTYIETVTTIPNKGSIKTAQGISYDETWGYVSEEIGPLDLASYNNSSTRNKNRIYYTYHSKYGFLTSKEYYQNNNTKLIEQNIYDSLGRKTQSIDAAGNKTYYQYPATSGSYPGNMSAMYDLKADGTKNASITYM